LAPHRYLALSSLALLTAGCPASTGEFQRQDFSKPSVWPGSSIIVGQNVVVRLASGPRPDAEAAVSLSLDLFPPGAVLRGARVQVVRRGQVYEGPAKVWPSRNGQHYTVYGPDLLDPMARTERRGPDSTTVWLGPACLGEACETVAIHDADWPNGGSFR
jgi:hypothetical protein